MQIAQIKISNILGIKQLEFTPQGFNEISGENGEGKTSVLEAIKSVFEGGHDATLLRRGEIKGEIVVVLDEGTEITKKVTESASPTIVKQGDEKLKRPTDFIKGLSDLISINPVGFLHAPKKDRVRVLLDTMPINVDVARLERISGVSVSGGEGLAVIDFARQQVFNDRTGTNRAVKEKEATINQLKLAMPDAPNGIDGSEEELRAQHEELIAERDKELTRVTLKLEGIINDKKATIELCETQERADIDKARAEAQAQIDAIKEALQAKADGIKAMAKTTINEINTEIAEVKAKASTQREKTIQKCTAAAEPIKQAITSIVENRNAHAKREQAMQTVKQMEGELILLQQDAEQQNNAIEAIDEYKIELLSSLPIKGLEVIGGDIFRDGVQFDRLNTAQQVDIAVEIAKLRAGSLNICCVDGIELLDSKSFEEFKRRAIESGLQLFVSRVADTPFTIK
mgnify:CR=1 FL=1